MRKVGSSICVLIACCLLGQPGLAQNVITDWAGIVQPAIHNASATRPPASSEVLHALIQLAMYDAAIAIEGGYQPYGPRISAPGGADVRVAVATAAYRTARARVASSQVAYLDSQYQAYLAPIPDGPAKDGGVQVGEAAANALLLLRADDGYDRVVEYNCSSVPPPTGEFEPNAGCGTQPVDAKVGQITPYTLVDPSGFRPGGPLRLTSGRYTRDFTETRDFGQADSIVRTPEQTDIAYFWSEHTYVFWNRNLVNLAIRSRLSVREAARPFALVHTAAADAIIAGFNAKYFFRHWRPRTAIPRADTDGNPDTDPEPGWTPLLSVNHPEYPSAHGFWSSAVVESVALYYRTKGFSWTLSASKAAVPQLVETERTYCRPEALVREIDDARVWSGLHWRHAMLDGDRIGRAVERQVYQDHFRPTRRRH
jgi:hypothetical protein